MAEELGLPVMALLKKTRNTKPMNKLGAAARRANVLGAFAADCPPGSLEGLSILIVDDVYTTGATLSECARVLREAGAAHVYGAAFAKAGMKKK
jgi:predicted amidophosphoribosyltransferase